MPHLTLQYPGLPATRAGQRRGDAGRLPSRVESAFLGARLASPARAGRSPQQSLAIAASRDGSFGRTRKSSKGTPTAECEVAVKEIVATSPFYWDEPCDDLSKEFAYLEALKARLAACADEAAKVEVLRSNERVTSLLTGFSEGPRIASAIASLPVHMQLVLYALPAAGQAHILWVPEGMPDDDVVKGLRKLANRLVMVETFYSAIGGVVGYQHKMISLILESTGEACKSTAEAAGAGPAAFHLPCGTNLLDDDGTAARRSARAGLEALAVMGELYPLGGAGDRLGLKCEVTGEALPVALLPYAGRTLLEGLIRDVQAREYLHFRTLGVQHVTPVAIMTSKAKGNHQRLSGVCEGHGWFGRGEESFRLFRQPMVPLVGAEDGRWLLPKPFSPKLKPGGHGAIWKLMLDEGVFDWFRGQGRKATIVRQISNPMAGTDVTLLALAGTGAAGGKKFGFASCERPIGNAEGVNVLVERTVGAGRYTYGVSNVEYTEFDRIGLKDAPPPDKPDSTLSKFPANTNVLYVDCGAAEAIVANDDGSGSATLPGMIVNLKKVTKYTDCRTGEGVAVRAGRLECTMQNLADSMVDEFAAPLADEERDSLSTFVLYNKRSRVMSSAKRKLNGCSHSVNRSNKYLVILWILIPPPGDVECQEEAQAQGQQHPPDARGILPRSHAERQGDVGAVRGGDACSGP
mmetsp:Transcript_2837/g.9609  ORF Transcript_2837/g.9609 Transcript_2837/m.9609 type:complete len:690 (-) Transcript_2837:227-2296(-)